MRPSTTLPRTPPPVITIEETRIPAWYLFLLFPMLASFLLFLLMQPPMPVWLRVVGHAAWAVPAGIFLAGLLLVFSRQFADAGRASVVRNFIATDRTEDEIRMEWTREFMRRIGRQRINLDTSQYGTHHDQICEFITATIGPGQHQYPCFLATVQTIPAPSMVCFARRAVRWNPSLARPRFKLGPAPFRSRWDITGDRETAELLLTDPVIEALPALIPHRAQAWCWNENRLAVLLRGEPTAYGIDTTLNAVVAIAQAATILPSDPTEAADDLDNPPADPAPTTA